MGIENYRNVLNTLIIVKEKYGINPKLVTCDFSPNIIKSVCEVFGEEKLQIDGFHVMQELNRGVRTDLLDYRKKLFVNEIQMLKSLRECISLWQKQGKLNVEDLKNLKTRCKDLKSTKSQIFNYINMLEKCIKLMKVISISEFNIKLDLFMNDLSLSPDDNKVRLFLSLQKCLPKREMTSKGIKRFKDELLKKMKTFFLSYRSDLESRSKKFHHDYWILFCQPETMNSERLEFLTNFLKIYPDLKEYRDITLSLGEIYRDPLSKIDGHQIDELIIKAYYSDKLKTAIKTIKKFKDSIIRFSYVFKDNSRMAKTCRASMEYFNNKFKAPFKRGYNRSSKTTLQRKLAFQLGSDVQFSI